MKRTLCALLCVFLIFLSACWDARELSDIGIVVMTGFDLDDDGQDRVTVFSVQPFGQASEIGEAATTWIGTASGKSAFEALRNLRRISTRKLVFDHNKIVLIGKKKAQQDFRNVIDVLARSREFRYDTTVFLTDGTAEGMMDTPAALEKSLFRELMGMIDNTEEWSKGFALTVKDFSISAMSAHRHGYVIGNMGFYKTDQLPFTIDRRQYLQLYWKETAQSTAYVGGGGVIDENRLIGWLSPTELQAYLIVSDQIQGGFTLNENVPDSESEITVDIIKLKTEITFPRVSGDEIAALVKVKVTSILQEVNGAVPDYDEAFISKLEKLLAKKIISEMDIVVQRAQNDLRSDFLGFHKEFSVSHAKEWKKVKSNWCEVFCKIGVDYDVELEIKWQGLLSRTLAGKEG